MLSKGRSKIAPGGFEPPFSDPKSDVLPLDEGAKPLKLVDLTNSFNAVGAARDYDGQP
jgi:hypothetical protein